MSGCYKADKSLTDLTAPLKILFVG